MLDIPDVIYSIFSERDISENSKRKLLLNELIEKENELLSTLSDEQHKQYKSINEILNNLQSETEYELVQFTLEFISKTLIYTNQKD